MFTGCVGMMPLKRGADCRPMRTQWSAWAVETTGFRGGGDRYSRDPAFQPSRPERPRQAVADDRNPHVSLQGAGGLKPVDRLVHLPVGSFLFLRGVERLDHGTCRDARSDQAPRKSAPTAARPLRLTESRFAAGVGVGSSSGWRKGC